MCSEFKKYNFSSYFKWNFSDLRHFVLLLYSMYTLYVYLKSVPNLGYLIFMSGILYIEQSIFTEFSTKHPWGTPFYILYVYLKSVLNLEYLIFMTWILYMEQSIFTEVSTKHPWGTPFYTL